MFWNITNHPISGWEPNQLAAAKELSHELRDLPFPCVSPELTSSQVQELATSTVHHILILAKRDDVAHVMGELTLTFAIVRRLQDAGIKCVASTTARDVVQQADGSKISHFRFVAFREYETING